MMKLNKDNLRRRIGHRIARSSANRNTVEEIASLTALKSLLVPLENSASIDILEQYIARFSSAMILTKNSKDLKILDSRLYDLLEVYTTETIIMADIDFTNYIKQLD